MKKNIDFKLQFRDDHAKKLIEIFMNDNLLMEKEKNAFTSGEKIRKGIDDFGQLSKQLEIIYKWKTGGRGINRFKSNGKDEVKDALNLAMSASTERCAVAVLMGLHGVNVPVASAILTTIDPIRYTIIDFRALESLGVKDVYPTVSYYIEYLNFCRKKSKELDVSLRHLDYALWGWSKEQAKGRANLGAMG